MSNISTYLRGANVLICGGAPLLRETFISRLTRIPTLGSVLLLDGPATSGPQAVGTRAPVFGLGGDAGLPHLGLEVELLGRLAEVVDVVIDLGRVPPAGADLEACVRATTLPALELARAAAWWPRLRQLVRVTPVAPVGGPGGMGGIPEAPAAWPTPAEADLITCLGPRDAAWEALGDDARRALGSCGAFAPNLAERLIAGRYPCLPTLTVRAGALCGPWRGPEGEVARGGLLTTLLEGVFAGDVPWLAGDPWTRIDVVPADHVVHLTLAHLAYRAPGRATLHAGAGGAQAPLTLGDIASAVRAARPDRAPAIVSPVEYEARWARSLAGLTGEARRRRAAGKALADHLRFSTWGRPVLDEAGAVDLYRRMLPVDRMAWPASLGALCWRSYLGAAVQPLAARWPAPDTDEDRTPTPPVAVADWAPLRRASSPAPARPVSAPCARVAIPSLQRRWRDEARRLSGTLTSLLRGETWAAA